LIFSYFSKNQQNLKPIYWGKGMEEKEILNQLVNVADKSEKRVDKYIEITQEFLKNSPDWTEQHGTIFKEMLSEIRSSRKIKNIALIAIIVLTCLLITVSLISFVLNKKSESDQALIETARKAQLAVRLENPNGINKTWLDVKVDPEAESDPELKKRMNKILESFPALGRHYGLGQNKVLKVNHEDSYRWTILPESGDTTQTLGYIKVNQQLGSIDYTNKRVELGEVIRYQEVSDFYVKILSYKRRNPQIPDTEKIGNKPIVWLPEDDAITVDQSANGQIIEEPFFITHSKWENMYVVSIGIGRLGEKDGKEFAWYLNSFVRSINFD
jgi:hypothetical protein